MKLIDEQIAIETNAHHEAKARYDKYKMKEDMSFVQNPISSNLLSHIVPYYAIQLEKWWDEEQKGRGPKRRAELKKYFKELSLDSVGIGVAALRVIFTILFQKKPSSVVNIAEKVYTAVHVENSYEQFRLYKKNDDLTNEQKRDWSEINRRLLDFTRDRRMEDKIRVLAYARETFTDLSLTEPEDRTKAGVALINIALSLRVSLGKDAPCKMFQTRLIVKKGKRSRILTFTKDVQEYLAKAENQLGSVLFSYYPMVVPPTPWEALFGGGYVTPRGRGNLPLIKSPNIQLYKDHDIGEQVYKAVNVVQETPWKINKKIFAIMEYCTKHGLEIGELPVRTKEFELPENLPDEEWKELTIEEKQEVINERKTIHRRMDSDSSKVLSLKLKLSMARRFLRYEEIYFPHTLDFRGRIYPIASAVNPQSDKYGQALLHFAKGEEIGESGRRWLAIHGANCYGLDSESFDVRVKFIEDNAEDISASAENPLGRREFWSKADDPFGFLAFCFEWGEMLKLDNQLSYKSQLPVKLDATSSGLQHYSAIFRDHIGAKATNLVDGDRSDIYKLVSAETEKLIHEDLKTETDPAVKQWKRSLLSCMNRDMCKPATMCLPYGISLFGTTDALIEKYEDGKMKDVYLPGNNQRERTSRIRHLAKLIMDGVGKVVNSAIIGMDWLKTAERTALTSGQNRELRFITKLGFPFIQQYYKARSKRVKMLLGQAKVFLSAQKYSKTIDKRKSNTAIAPNFIHSQDATHLLKCALEGHEAGIEAFSFIHDSFGVHAAKTEDFRDVIRKSFVWLYEGDTFGEAKKQWQEQFPDAEIPEPPYEQYGQLDITKCLDSSYLVN